MLSGAQKKNPGCAVQAAKSVKITICFKNCISWHNDCNLNAQGREIRTAPQDPGLELGALVHAGAGLECGVDIVTRMGPRKRTPWPDYPSSLVDYGVQCGESCRVEKKGPVS